MWRGVSSSLALRAGAPKSSSNAGFVIVSPVQ